MPPAKRSAEVNIDSATGQPYVIYEGLTMDTILDESARWRCAWSGEGDGFKPGLFA